MKYSTYNRLEKKKRAWINVIANQIFVDYVHSRSLEDACERIVKHRQVITKLRNLLDYEEKWRYRNTPVYDENGKLYTYEPDLRTGDETYGYKSLESITNNLEYISDRFCAEFRLTWLLEVPEKVQKLKESN
jgi:hypothetical protein